MMSITRSLRWSLLLFTLLACLFLPHVVTHEPPNTWTESPRWENFALFGTYQGENLLYVVARAARLSLYLSTVALLLSVAAGITLIFLDFYAPSHRLLHGVLRGAVYFPRLFVLILLAAALRLYEPSRLAVSLNCLGFQAGVEWWLIVLLGATGAIFLASQTSLEVAQLREQLFVQFAASLRLAAWRIFFRHILRNCTLLPIAIAKQLRDNIVSLATLSFIGLVHLQPEELGGLICKYYNAPEAFYAGWWILFFPCATLAWLVILFDLLAATLSKRLNAGYRKQA
jgi:ABC-type dipeptide/oligopeptide/nickel transport system permease subunit